MYKYKAKQYKGPDATPADRFLGFVRRTDGLEMAVFVCEEVCTYVFLFKENWLLLLLLVEHGGLFNGEQLLLYYITVWYTWIYDYSYQQSVILTADTSL